MIGYYLCVGHLLHLLIVFKIHFLDLRNRCNLHFYHFCFFEGHYQFFQVHDDQHVYQRNLLLVFLQREEVLLQVTFQVLLFQQLLEQMLMEELNELIQQPNYLVFIVQYEFLNEWMVFTWYHYLIILNHRHSYPSYHHLRHSYDL